MATLHFEPSLGGLEATYAVHLRLTGKAFVLFLLVITELFSLGATVEAIQANIDCKSLFLKGWVSLAHNFRYNGDVPRQPFFVSEN